MSIKCNCGDTHCKKELIFNQISNQFGIELFVEGKDGKSDLFYLNKKELENLIKSL